MDLTSLTECGVPTSLGRRLLVRWNEPHRRYHGTSHLAQGLVVLAEMKASAAVTLAWWFHDAVHHSDPPTDEQSSAMLARDWLRPALPAADVDEVARLVLLTIDHRPDPADDDGAQLCDADLSALASPWPNYLDQVAGLRAERPDLDDATWQAGRVRRLETLLTTDHLFHTAQGRRLWEPLARANLERELHQIVRPEPMRPMRAVPPIIDP